MKYKLEPLIKKNKWEIETEIKKVKLSQEELDRLKNKAKYLLDEIKNSENTLRETMSENNQLSTDMYTHLSAYINDQYAHLENNSIVIREKENEHYKLSENIKNLNKLDKGLEKHKDKTKTNYLSKIEEDETNQNDELFNTRIKETYLNGQ